MQIRGGVYPNLFDAHPPFQIDGNFAFTAGVAEMLIQSHESVAIAQTSNPETPIIHLLPALPAVWPAGSVRGWRARGGFELTRLDRKEGRLTRAEIKSVNGSPWVIRHGDKTAARQTKAGESFVCEPVAP